MADNMDKYYQQSQVLSKNQPSSYLDHLCGLDIDCEPYSVRHTGIICTIGNEKLLKFIIPFFSIY